jgi:hypothetical protein
MKVKRYFVSENNFFVINPSIVIHSHSNICKEVTWKIQLEKIIMLNAALA